MLPGGRNSWWEEIAEPAWRFPLPAAFAVLALLVNLEGPDYRQGPTASQLMLSFWCVGGFLWSWAAALWAEVHGDRLTGVLIGLGGAVLLALIFRIDLVIPLYLSGAEAVDEGAPALPHAILLAALALAPVLAPYSARRVSQSAFWQYSHKWAISVLAGAAGSVLAFFGAFVVIGSAASLFDVQIPRWLEGDIRLTCALLVLPWIWLALTPRDFREQTRTGADQEFTSRAVWLLVIYILIPVAFALWAVLAAYVVKVLVEGSFVAARLGLTSIEYGAGLIAVVLMAWPQRNSHPLARRFWRAWPFMLIVPTVLLVPTLWLRIAEFGWTPPRYIAVVIALWIGGTMLAGVLMRGAEDLRLIVGLLAGLLAVTAFGPWGIAQVSAHSQFERLEALLTAKGLLVNGRWRENPGPIPWYRADPGHHAEPGAVVLVGESDHKIASSALEVLARTSELDRLRPWFEGQGDDPFEARKPRQSAFNSLNQKLDLLRGAPPYQGRSSPPRIVFSAVNPTVIDLPGEPGTLVGPLNVGTAYPRQSFETDAGQVTLSLQGKQVLADLGTTRIGSFDLAAALDNLDKQGDVKAGQPSAVAKKALLLRGREGSRAWLAITFVAGNLHEPQASIQMTGYLLLPPAP